MNGFFLKIYLFLVLNILFYILYTFVPGFSFEFMVPYILFYNMLLLLIAIKDYFIFI